MGWVLGTDPGLSTATAWQLLFVTPGLLPYKGGGKWCSGGGGVRLMVQAWALTLTGTLPPVTYLPHLRSPSPISISVPQLGERRGRGRREDIRLAPPRTWEAQVSSAPRLPGRAGLSEVGPVGWVDRSVNQSDDSGNH